jgi:hypothetical protein
MFWASFSTVLSKLVLIMQDTTTYFIYNFAAADNGMDFFSAVPAGTYYIIGKSGTDGSIVFM